MDENATVEFCSNTGFLEINFFNNESLLNVEKIDFLKFLMQEYDLKQPVVFSEASSFATQQFIVNHYVQQHSKIDLLYLDMTSTCEGIPVLVDQLWGLLSPNGIICIESDPTTESTEACQPPGEAFEPVFVTKGFSIFTSVNGKRPLRSMRYQIDLFQRKLYFERKRNINAATQEYLALVAVIVLSYKHEDYIEECLRSVLCQRGQFRMRVIIIDDASPDGTSSVIESVIAEKNNDRTEIAFEANTQNVGVVANLATAMERSVGCDYLTFCEGDDFWTSEIRIQKHIDFLSEHPECVMSFNSIEYCDAAGGSKRLFDVHKNLVGSELSGDELANDNFIGNFTACFYRGEFIGLMPAQIFKIYTVDWFFNLYCSQFGKIGHIKEVLSAYRIHVGGEWSSQNVLDKALKLLRLIGQYSSFLDYQYNDAFQRFLTKIYQTLDHVYSGCEGNLDLLIVDDVFPALQSGFRYAEFTAYLREFQGSLVLVSGKTLHVVGEKSLTEVVRNYQRKHPDVGHKVVRYEGDFPLRLAKLIYVNFLSNAYELLPAIEAAKVPFVFTLYPGAKFVLNDTECNRKLKQVFDSPCFQKVIVTQQVTYDYIVHQGLCPADKIKMIFGVVMPEISEDRSAFAKVRWRFGKSRLDICFMAHKYTPYGEDKGYDVFVNVARILRQQYDDIFFHVVGPFDRRVIDVSSFSDRIKFHGALNPEEFDSFFQEIDIILSPNISNKLSPGSFDGFPTASCTEAGLRGVAIFAVDEFNSSVGRFTDGEDIVLIKYDFTDIVDKIKMYYSNPLNLRAVGEKGSCRIRELYSYDAQMKPRIALLREVMSNPEIAQFVQNHPALRFPRRYNKQFFKHTMPLLVWNFLRKYCPEPLKKIYRSWK